MALTVSGRKRIKRDYSDNVHVNKNATANLSSEDIDVAAQAMATFLDDNFADLNRALPQPFKGLATREQKLKLFKFVVSQLEMT